jgi:hypothetical protein
MKKTILATLAVILLLSGCSGIIQPASENTSPLPTPGTGLVRVRLGVQGVDPSYSHGLRTIMPDAAGLYYTLAFSASGQTTV